MVSYRSELEIQELVESFSCKTLPKVLWTHKAHLTVALWHVYFYDLSKATELIKSGIKSYNLAIGVPNTSISGYHETLTIFWLEVVANYRKRHSDKSLLDLCNDFLKSEYASRELPFRCLPVEKLLNIKARESLEVKIFEGAWKTLFPPLE